MIIILITSLFVQYLILFILAYSYTHFLYILVYYFLLLLQTH